MRKYFLILGLILVLGLTACSPLDVFKVSKVLTPEEAKAKAEKFVNENLVSADNLVTVTDVIDEGGLYKMSVNFTSGQKVDAYLSKDGTKFYPQAYDLDEKVEPLTSDPTATATPQEMPKTDKPVVELFVMSHCPYGTQIEKGILPVLAALKEKVEFSLKFNDYAMHGKQELDEQLNQYCINQNEPAKLLSYLKCFLTDGNGASCLTSEGIDQNKLKTCVSQADAKFKVTEQFNDQTTWLSGQFPLFDVNKDDNTKYGVQGSPTLIINGVEASASRDANSLLTAICGAFNNAPEECNTELSTTAPSTGFGWDASGANSAANCGI